MTEFDAARAVREQLTGLTDVMRTIRQRERTAEEMMSSAESAKAGHRNNNKELNIDDSRNADTT